MPDGRESPAVGDEWNGYVWNGSAWVPQVDGSGHVFDGARWSGPPGVGHGRTGYGSAGGYPSPVFAHQRYAYGLTQQTSDDLQFIVRCVKIAIIVGFVLGGVAIIGFLVSLLTLGTVVAGLPR